LTRAALTYNERREHRTFEGFDPDTPVAGFYRTRLRSGGVYVGVRIWFGAPLDPVTGEELDRGHRWQAHVNGAYHSIEVLWPKCADGPCDEAEYRHLSSLQSWASKHAPDSAIADPTKAIDPLNSPMMF
jgi:hypothetical protein